MYWNRNNVVESAVSSVVVVRDQRMLTRDVEFCDKHRECDADDLSPSQFRVFYILTCHFTNMCLYFVSLCVGGSTCKQYTLSLFIRIPFTNSVQTLLGN